MTDSEKLDLLLSNMQKVQTDMAEMKQDMTEMKQDMTEVRQDITEVRQDMAEMKRDITITKLTIENEIRVNIQRVAEGHLDLSRNLHEAVKLASDIKAKQEMQDIYLNIHETKLKAL
ncbi:MAG: hypothetical protein RRX92_09195 [Lachnospiraceae bacterium]